MTLGFDDCVATETTIASVAEVQINRGAALTTPNIANGIVEVLPYQFVDGAYTTDEALLTQLRITSNDVDMNPCRFNLPVQQGGEAAFTSMGSPSNPAYALNTPLAEQSRIEYFAQPQLASTVAYPVGATVVYTDSGVGQQQFFQKPDNESNSIAAVDSRATGNQITITGASQINQLIGFFCSNQTAGDMLPSQHFAGVWEFSSSDFDTPFPYRMGKTLGLSGLGVANTSSNEGMMRVMMSDGNGIPVSSRTTIDTFYTNRDATANIMNFIHNVGFLK